MGMNWNRRRHETSQVLGNLIITANTKQQTAIYQEYLADFSEGVVAFSEIIDYDYAI